MRSLAVAFAVLCLRAQTPLSPDLEALSKIRTRMIFNLKHQPNYTCVETIERSSRARATSKLRIVDTLRLEVALVDGREMFAWPGSKKFEDGDLTSMITTGAIGNGNFGTHAQALFGTHAATFHYVGEQDFQGKKAIRFDYDVPQILSGYRVRVAMATATVGYHGSFYADPSTFDMERIEVTADNLPPQLLLASTNDKIDYAVTRIGDADFLLPSQSELTMTNLQGGAEHNRVTFSACREFSGESVISFEEPAAGKSNLAPVPVHEFELPEGLAIELMTTREIDLHAAAIGDPVYARVERDVKQKGAVVIPKGATATGRIVRLEKYENYSILGIAFPEIEAPGILARMKGRMTGTVGPLAPRRGVSVRTPQLPGEGLIPVSASMRHLAKGCIMFWRT